MSTLITFHISCFHVLILLVKNMFDELCDIMSHMSEGSQER